MAKGTPKEPLLPRARPLQNDPYKPNQNKTTQTTKKPRNLPRRPPKTFSLKKKLQPNHPPNSLPFCLFLRKPLGFFQSTTSAFAAPQPRRRRRSGARCFAKAKSIKPTQQAKNMCKKKYIEEKNMPFRSQRLPFELQTLFWKFSS